LIYDFTIAFNDKNLISIDIIFLDYSNAFDVVNHNILFNELYEIGIRNNALKLLTNLLLNRKQFVSYENNKSFEYDITSGVIQGGTLSALLFNIYVRNIVKVIKFSSIKQFADDIVIYKLIYENSDSLKLQTDLESIYKWSTDYKLKLNPLKSKHMNITQKTLTDFSNYYITNISE
jgi:hypothetical protein